MNINVNTKYNIGDEVWVFRFMSESQNYKEWHYGIEKRTIQYIRVNYDENSKYTIQYFLNGLESYEGENWFNEESPQITDKYYWDGIFATEQEAIEYVKWYKEKYVLE